MNANTVVLLSAAMMSLVGCRKVAPDDYDGPMETNELCGVWMISGESLRDVLQVAHLPSATNRTDHILVLNADGTCIYRALDGYSRYEPEADERRASSLDALESTTRHERDNFRASWYLWDISSPIPVSGPYAERPSIRGSQRLFLNRWDLWSVESNTGKDPSYRGRYLLRCEQKYASGTTWQIGMRAGQKVLWKWLQPDEYTVEFEKVDWSVVTREGE